MKCSKTWFLTVACFVVAAAMVSPACASLLNLSAAPTNADQIWGDLVDVYGPQMAFDGSLATQWVTNGQGGVRDWIEVDLGSDMQLNSVEIDWSPKSVGTTTVLLRTAAQGLSLDPSTYTAVAESTFTFPTG